MSLSDWLRSAHNVLDAVFLYVACTADGFVKVGISRTPYERVYEIHVGSPSPVRAAQWIWLGSREVGLRIEKTVRREWESRHTRGEWYRFDYSKQEDKQEFHATLAAILEVEGCQEQWTRLNQEQTAALLQEMNKQALAYKQHPHGRRRPLMRPETVKKKGA